MSLFDGVAFEWGGKTVTIPPDRLLGALARLEEHIPLHQLADPVPRYSRLANGFAALLRYAGVATDAETVFAAMLVDPASRQAAHAAVADLVASANPPASLRSRSGGNSPSRRGLVETMAKAVLGGGWASPSEFRAMHPQEVWLLIEGKSGPRMVTPNMSEDEAEAIYAEAYGSEAA